MLPNDYEFGQVGSAGISTTFAPGSVKTENIAQRKDVKFTPLLNKIQALKEYGEKPDMIGAKGNNTIILAEKLSIVINKLLRIKSITRWPAKKLRYSSSTVIRL